MLREMLRIGRQWTGDAKEKEYIASEARKVFRGNRFLRDERGIERALDEARVRIHNAKQHGIAYKRLENLASSGGGEGGKIVPDELRREVGVFESVGLPINEDLVLARKKARDKRRNMKRHSLKKE